MEINIGDEKIVELVSAYSADEVLQRALARRSEAFGQFARFLQRPKPEEIEITQSQKRYEPFWYAAARAYYSYDRRHRYTVPAAPEVRSVTIYEHDHEVRDDRGHAFEIEALEHCVEEFRRELILDPQRGEERGDYARYLTFPHREVADVGALQADGVVAVLPEVRSSFLVRKLVQMLLKTFQADRIHEERIDVDSVALFFRPIYAFEYHWTTREKRSVVEFDALTGDVRAEGGQIKRQVVQVLENDMLFDVGADAVGSVLPGANIAIKVGRFAARKALS
jgi:hypothetical protein